MIYNESKLNRHWAIYALAELGDFKRGKSRHRPRNDARLFDDGKYPLIQTGEIKDANLFIRNHLATYSDFGLAQSELWPEGTLCITIAANIAETAILGYPMCFPDSVVGFRADSTVSSEIYMHYVFAFIRRAIQNSASGSIQDNINIEYLTGLRLRIPPKPEQDKIAAVLSALDAKIELNNRLNAELEGMAKLLYDYWFVQYDFPLSAAQASALGQPHLTGHPYRTSGGPMVYDAILKREIPKGWKVTPLFEAMSVQYGFPFSTTQFTTDVTNVPVVRIRDILENTISLYTTERVDEKYKLAPHDLVIGMDGNFHMNFWDKEGSYLNQRSVRVRAKEKSAISSFQAYFELSPYIKAREKNVSRTTVGHLSDKDLKRLHLLEPETSIEFAPRATFDSFLSKVLLNRAQNQELARLRDWLLPMLMNGQVTVR
jgi:type I restriction enzyme S subunit